MPLVFYGPIVAMLATVGVVAAVIALASPVAGVSIMFFLGSIGDLQHFQGGYSLAKVLILLLLVGLLAKLVVGRMPIRRSGLMPQVVLFLLVFVVISVRGLGSGVHTRDAITVLGYPAAFLLTLNLLRSERSIQCALGALVTGATLTSIAAVLQRYAGFSLLTALRGQQPVLDGSGVPGLQRMAGLMHDPNAAAYPSILVIPVLIATAASARRRSVKIGLLVLAALSGLGLALTLSRSGYLAAICGVLCLVLYLPYKQKVRILAVAGAALALILLFVPSHMLTARFEIIPTELGGVSDRSIYYLTAVKLVSESPLLGVGDAKFMSSMQHVVGVRQGPHSNILSIVVDSGLVGVASLLWLVWTYVVFVNRGIFRMAGTPLKTYAIGAYAGLIGFQVQGLFISNMGWFLIWAMAAVPLCCVLVHSERMNTVFGRPAPGRGEYDGEMPPEALLHRRGMDGPGRRLPPRAAPIYSIERVAAGNPSSDCPSVPIGGGRGPSKG
ncbi:MAG TPA: O-antigen ligase family protein [Terriglobia bacterium]|nr:O-antigen ligase family protein [Terriglobia bacterium]